MNTKQQPIQALVMDAEGDWALEWIDEEQWPGEGEYYDRNIDDDIEREEWE